MLEHMTRKKSHPKINELKPVYLYFIIYNKILRFICIFELIIGMMEENVVEINLMGGLGNQLFQIATAYAYASALGYILKLPNTNMLNTGRPRPTYWNTPLFLGFSALHVDDTYTIPKLISYSVRESSFSFTPLDERIATISNRETPYHRIRMNGYFQSWRYFDHMYDKIISDIIPVSRLGESLREIYKSNLPAIGNSDGCCQYVCLHFRRGDYLSLPDVYTVLPVAYYENALRNIFANPDVVNDVRILYFCEYEDIDVVMHMIRQLERGVIAEFSGTTKISFHRAPASSQDWEQLIMMSLCDFNVIANSSFSWWGAYLQPKHRGKTSRVFYPSKWFAEKSHIQTHDLCLPNWVSIPF